MQASPRHEGLYAHMPFFDIAFEPEDLAHLEVFLRHLCRSLGRGELSSYLETFCGPGYLMHRLARTGVRAYGVDEQGAATEYAREKAIREARAAGGGARGNGQPGSPLSLAQPPFALPVRALPTEFTLPQAVELAFCPRGGLRYLLSDEDVIAHFVAVARNLGAGGLYVLELDHPGIYFGQRRSLRQWRRHRGETRVAVEWREARQEIDPVRHTVEVEVTLNVVRTNDAPPQTSSTAPAPSAEELPTRIRDSAPLRCFTYRELHALVKLAGVFEWVATFGDLDAIQPFDASPGARAMVPVLRCCL